MDDRGPGRKDVRDRTPAHVVAAQPGDQLGGPIPQPNDAAVVDEEDPVADRLQDLCSLLALGSGGAGDSLRGLEPTALRLGLHPGRRLRLCLPVETGVSVCGRHLCDEALDELELLLRVRASIAHQLDDTDDAPLVLDRHHQRGLRPRRSRLRNLLHGSLAIDVVVRPFTVLNALGSVTTIRPIMAAGTPSSFAALAMETVAAPDASPCLSEAPWTPT